MDAAAVGLHDLHWDIFISYILPVLSFADCCNLLIVLYGSSFNQTELEAFLAGQDLDAFWKAKFQSLDGSPRVSWGDLERVLPSLCSTPLLYRGQSTLLRDLPWYHRAKIRHETVQDLRKTVAHVRREKLLHLLTRRFPDAEAGFLSEFLASDPTDIRYPRRDHAGGSIHDSDRSGRAVPHFSVGNIRGGGGGGGGAAAHGLEYGEPAATFTRHYHEETGLWRGTGWLHEVLGPYFDGATSRDLEPGRPCNEIMCPLFAVADGLVMCNMREPFDVTANEVFAFGKEDGLRFLARDTPAKPHSLPLGTPLLRAGVWRTRELGPVARPQKRQDPTDMSILPVGSLVRYRTLVLVGAGEKPLRVGAVIGWSVDHSPERRVTYRVLPIWAPEEEPPADNANLYHRTRHLIEPIISMEWLTEVSPEIELEMERFKFKTCSDPFFDGFDGKKFLIPTPGLTKIYPDDEAARQRLSM